MNRSPFRSGRGAGRLTRGPRRVALTAALALVAVVAAAGLAVPGGVGAQDATPGPDADAPATISIGGQGRVTIEPDTASVVAGIDILRPTLAEAQAEATTQMTAIIDAVKAAGIEERDIKTVNYSVNIVRDYDQNGNPAEIQGYQVSNQVAVVIRDTDALGEILDAVVAEGANNIYGISFYVEDTEAAASQARRQAVEDARRKAQELADAAGMTLGRVVSISEGSTPGPIPIDFGRAEAGMAQDSAAPVPVQIGTSEIAIDVQMTFELV